MERLIAGRAGVPDFHITVMTGPMRLEVIGR